MTFDMMGDFYYNFGLKLIKDGYITRGVEYFQKSLSFKNSIDCLNVLGLGLYRLGKFNKAKAAWQKSIVLDSSNENQAVSYLNHLEDDEFKNMLLHFNSAVEHGLSKNYKKAVKTLEKENIHRYPIVLIKNLYGLYCLSTGDKQKAISSWQQALEIDKSNLDACYYLSHSWDYDNEGLLNWIRNKFKF